jgi:ACS family D-galactonate transporter-like MFS transporter
MGGAANHYPHLMPPDPARPPGIASVKSRIVWSTTLLLVASVIINYADRGNLSVAAPVLATELQLSPRQLGVLLSAFFWTYATCQLLSGWLVDRFDANWILAAGFLLWSVATGCTGLAYGFGGLLALRLLVGVAESTAYPAYSKIFATYFDENHRGIANALIDAGSKIGPTFSTLAGGFLIARFGWRPFFFALGLGALPWLPCWIRWRPRGPAVAPYHARERPTFWQILRRRAAWVTFAGLFSANYFWYFLLTWLPTYLVQERHFSLRTMALAGSVPLILTAGATTAAGALSFRALARGASPTRVRTFCVSAGLGLATVIVAVPLIADPRVAIAVLSLASMGYGLYTSSHWAITQTIAGPAAVGRWTGLQNGLGNLAGVVAPIVTGVVVQATGHFFWAFAATGAVALAGSLALGFGLGPVEAVAWPRPALAVTD